MDDELISIRGEIPQPRSRRPDTEQPIRVPLVIYIGNERKIIGEADVVGEQVTGYIDPRLGKDLGSLVDDGTIQTVSVAFNAPPSTPVFRDGRIKWIRNY